MYGWLERLNEEQREAATFDGGPLRILAGAGTGKTTTLTARAAWLVASGVRPERILLLTFTRRAAREMISRAQRLVSSGGDTNNRIVGGTFHSVAHRILRMNAPALGLSAGYSVIDPSDAADVVGLVRHEVGAAGLPRRFPRAATLLDLYSRTVNTGRPLRDVVAESAPWCLEDLQIIADVCRGYVARKRAAGLVDFDDLLLFWRAAATHDDLGAQLGAAFDHILVDEYQDVNRLQVDIVAALRRSDDRVTIVGDDAQAVYGFRGADPRHLLDVAVDFPGTTTIRLGQNYRSVQPILDVANRLSDDAPEGFSVRLTATSPGGNRPTMIRCHDEDAEVQSVCDHILAHREEGLALRDQAVLVRASHHSDLLELELARRSIPFVKYGGLRFLDAAHVKDVVCAFRLADNPRDEPAWFRLLQRLDGVGPVTARRALTALGIDEDGDDASVWLRWILAAEELPGSARHLADALVATLRPRHDESVASHAERVIDAYRPILDGAFDDAAVRAGDLDALIAAAGSAGRLSDIAAEVTLEPPRSTSDLADDPMIDEDWLVISTIHSAKGLEWDAVHLIRAADGNLPSDMALGSPEGLEEERRLFYVAATRARRSLHVYVPERFHIQPRRHDAHLWGRPSRFLTPSVAACFDEESSGSGDHEPTVDLGTIAAVDVALDALWG